MEIFCQIVLKETHKDGTQRRILKLGDFEVQAEIETIIFASQIVQIIDKNCREMKSAGCRCYYCIITTKIPYHLLGCS